MFAPESTQTDALACEDLRMRRNGRQRHGSGAFDHDLFDLYEGADGAFDRVLAHDQDVVNEICSDGSSDPARGLDCDAVRNRLAVRSSIAFAERMTHAGERCRLHADHLDARLHGFRGNGASGDQAPAADGYDECIEVGEILEELQRESSLARDHERIIEWVD